MEIHRQDFEKSLPQIREAILSADFISIDTELTGLTLPDIQMQATDSLYQRYDKLRRSVEKFSVVQFGVCTFKQQPDGTFVAKPHNFYIFGGDNDSITTKRAFSCLTSSIKFLHDNKFDFNKWIEYGIPFYNFSEEDTKHTTFHGTSMHVRESQLSERSLNGASKEYLANIKKKLNYWWRGNTQEPLHLAYDKPFHKRLLHQAIRDSAYNGYLQAKEADDNNNTIIITCLSEQEHSQKYSQAPIVNFRAIIEMIKIAKCPVVLHNAAYDVFHTVDQFWRYLPNEIYEFKKLVNSMWDQIVDTKYLAEYHPKLQGCFSSSALGPLYNQVNGELKEAAFKINFGEGFDRYVGNADKAHEAAYDAYMTGVVYLAFIMYIQENEDEKSNNKKMEEKVNEKSSPSSSSESSSVEAGQKRKKNMEDGEGKRKKTKLDESPKDEDESSSSDEEGIESSSSSSSSDSEEEGLITSSDEAEVNNKAKSVFMSDSITPYYGRIFLMNSDIPFLNLKGKETLEIRAQPNKFYLRNIPVGLTKQAIEKLYPTLHPFAVSWINDQSAWLILRDESKIQFAQEGRLGLSSLVQSFLPGSSRHIEGEAFGITKDAGNIELMSHKNYIQQYGASKVVDNRQTNYQPTPSGGSSYADMDIPIPKSFQ